MPRRKHKEQPAEPGSLPRLYTVPQAEEVLNTNKYAIYRLSKPGGPLKRVMVGGSIRITERSIYKYVNDQLKA